MSKHKYADQGRARTGSTSEKVAISRFQTSLSSPLGVHGAASCRILGPIVGADEPPIMVNTCIVHVHGVYLAGWI